MRFFLFDRIVEFEKNERCVGIKCVSYSEDFFDKHYDRSPVMPESLVLEAMGQVGSWATAASIDFEACSVLLSFSDFKCYKDVKPGDTLRAWRLISLPIMISVLRFQVERWLMMRLWLKWRGLCIGVISTRGSLKSMRGSLIFIGAAMLHFLIMSGTRRFSFVFLFIKFV